MSRKDRIMGWLFIILWAIMAYSPVIIMYVISNLGLSRQADTIEATATYLSFIGIMSFLATVWALKCIEVGAKLCTETELKHVLQTK